MKILNAEQLRNADSYTIQNESVESIDLMERASKKIFEWLYKRVSRESIVKIFCGLGNNGGDGLAVSRMLADQGIIPQVFMVRYADELSSDCNANLFRLENEMGIVPFDILSEDDFPLITKNDVVVDAIFGSGLNRPLEGMVADLVSYLNQSDAIRVAIDIPTGMFANKPSMIGGVFKADYTLTFQTPKLSFMFPEYDAYVGHYEILNIGLDSYYMENVVTPYFLVENTTVKPILHKRAKFSHKGTFGHALLIAGSEAKTGAALLGAKACLRSGVGLLTVHLPKKSFIPIQVVVPESMIEGDESESCFSTFGDLSPYTAVGVGPGLGKSDLTANALKRLIQEVKVPFVMDADALNILSENKTWLPYLPPKTILTPHPKEFERLVGKTAHSFERLEKQIELSVKYNIVVVLKGANTSVSMPNGSCFFNSTGNPGMATAGSGDVLTGIILSLLAQHYAPEEAAVLGVYLHGLSGDLMAESLGYDSLIAGDLVSGLGKAFLQLKMK
jgi:yjeF C-terminal region, hydroxyethylthiazole kinase-related/yjeF N-terminal region